MMGFTKKTAPKKGYYDYLPGVEGMVSEPPSFALWAIPLVLSLLLVAVVLWLVLGKVDIVSPSQAIIIPDSRLQEIQAKESNRVADIFVEEGDDVEKGQKLVGFFLEDVDAEISSVEQEIKHLENEITRTKAIYEFLDGIDKTDQNNIESIKEVGYSDDAFSNLASIEKENIKNEISMQALQQKSMLEEIRTLKLELAGASKNYNYVKKNYERQKRLFKSNVISGEEFEQNEADYFDNRNRVAVTRQNIAKKNADYQSLKQEHVLFITKKSNEYLEKLVTTSRELDKLKNTLIQLNNQRKEKFLLSPIKGKVNEILVYGSGRVVQSGETVIRVVPDNSPLQARAKVLNRDIGFVEPGQNVNVKIDSFNFTKYGAIKGTVVHIAEAAIEDQQLGSYYPIIINLDRRVVDIGQGKKVELKPGMTATVDVHIGKRRLVEYIIAPLLRYKDEALREK